MKFKKMKHQDPFKGRGRALVNSSRGHMYVCLQKFANGAIYAIINAFYDF